VSTPSLLVRALDVNGDIQCGQGTGAFISDLDAVVQLLNTRLKLYLGEWWADQNDGLPMWQDILGVYGANDNIDGISLVIQQRILATSFVTGVNVIQASFNSSTRTFSFYAIVQTQFGTVQLSNQPSVVSQGLP
jgi:hypothetical protein